MNRSAIERLGYRPQSAQPLDVEIFTMADLRKRGSAKKVRTTHRYEFHMLACVMKGACTQVIDFRPVECSIGSLVVVRPGQAHNFGPNEDWDGWIVLFRQEFVLPNSTPTREIKFAGDLARLPEHMTLEGAALRTVSGVFAQMREDSQADGARTVVEALLRYQLHALLARLYLIQNQSAPDTANRSPTSMRFERFRQLVEERFTTCHQVAAYASQLGCSEKSLTRASVSGCGTTAKELIAARIALEAKRLLVHTDLTIASIAEKLGFDEPTNFSKFFRREAQCTPAEFRREQLAASLSSH